MTYEIIFDLSVAFIISCFLTVAFAKQYVVSCLQDIETYPKMYGTVAEIEILYVHTLVIFSGMDIFRAIRRKKPIGWGDWNQFVRRKLNKPLSSTSALDYKVTTVEELIQLLQEFRKESF